MVIFYWQIKYPMLNPDNTNIKEKGNGRYKRKNGRLNEGAKVISKIILDFDKFICFGMVCML